MNGLRAYERDTSLLARAGDARLCPPDEAELVARVNAAVVLLPAPALEARWEHVRWKPHVSCAALAAVRCADGVERLVTWKRYATDKVAHLAETMTDAADEPSSRAVVVDVAAGVVLAAFPADRALPGLARALDVQRSCRILAAVAPFAGRNVRHRRSTATLVRYKPERRAVLRLDVVTRVDGDALATTPVGLRVLEPDAAERLVRARRDARFAPDLAPEVLAHEPRTGLVFETWWDVAAPRPDDFTNAREAGRALARVHAQAVSGPSTTVVDPTAGVELALFEVDRALWSAVHGWCAAARPLRAATACVHGDFHPDQLVRSRADGALRVLDWDATHVGAGVVDVASYAADAWAAGESAVEAEIVAGYREAGGRDVEPEALARAVSAALVARAAGALRRVERDAIATATRLVELARARVGGAP